MHIQEHPDARSYRVRTLPSYNKLCAIFGEEHSDGRYSRLSRNEEPGGELAILMTGMYLTENPDGCSGHKYFLRSRV